MNSISGLSPSRAALPGRTPDPAQSVLEYPPPQKAGGGGREQHTEADGGEDGADEVEARHVERLVALSARPWMSSYRCCARSSATQNRKVNSRGHAPFLNLKFGWGGWVGGWGDEPGQGAKLLS